MNDLVKLRQRQKSPLDISLERMSKKTKERNDKFQNQEKVDLGIQTIYDKIKFYPKFNYRRKNNECSIRSFWIISPVNLKITQVEDEKIVKIVRLGEN